MTSIGRTRKPLLIKDPVNWQVTLVTEREEW
jgi:hypothetical protein